MTLGELIEALEKADQSLVVPIGFCNPHSYRGYYDELAFEPMENVSVASMLAAAKSALGETYRGWKGGDFRMDKYTPVWLSREGEGDMELTGETIGPTLLYLMLSAKP